MKKIINKKSLKGTLAVMLCAVMAFSVCACDFDSDTEPTKTDAQIQFDKYCDDLFSEELEDDALTAHFDISNPSDYGLKYDEEDYTLGHVSDEDTKESFDEQKEINTLVNKFHNLNAIYTFDSIIGESRAITEVKNLGKNAALSPAPARTAIPENLNWRIKGLCFSMRSAICLWNCRHLCSASCSLMR